ncbi:peptidase domain-containing ABC transporter [Aquimarina sp. M1]
MMKFPHYRQHDQMDCGPTCLKMITKHYGKENSIETLRQKSHIDRQGVSIGGIAEAAEDIGMRSLAVSLTYELLEKEAPLPCVVYWRQRHFVVVYKITKDKVFVADPAHGLITYTKKKFIEAWVGTDQTVANPSGYVLLLETTPEFYQKEGEKSTFGYRFLLNYFRPYKKYFVQLLLGMGVGSLLQLILPFLTQSVVDYGINHQNIGFVYLILLGQLMVFISRSIVDIIRGWILLHMTSRVNINLISDFLLKIMRLPISYFDSKNTGDILQRIHDHDRIQEFLSNTSLSTLFSLVNLLIFGGVLAYYNMTIFLVFLIGSTFYFTWTLIFLKQRATLDHKTFDQSADNQDSMMQLIEGMQEIKLNGSERRRRWEWESIQVRLYKISRSQLTLNQTQNNGALFLNELKNILITFIAATAVIKGELTLGMMLSIQYIIGQLNLPINDFIQFVQAGQDAKLSLGRLSEIHNKDNEDEDDNRLQKELPNNADIVFDDVSFRYGSRVSPLVLKNLDFTIPQGKVTAIVGASGSGKTTLLKMLLKFYSPISGTIKIAGTSMNSYNAKSWRRACGSVMQEGFIFNDTIARNITESDSENVIDKERLLHAVKVANIHQFIEELPAGYNTKIGSTGTNISGGQKQRILIARAVYKNPDYIFFDEATSALDANNEKVIMENLQEFYEGKTVVVVAHRLSTVKNADQIIVLEDGEIIERGTHKELTAARKAYYTLVKNQLELGN